MLKTNETCVLVGIQTGIFTCGRHTKCALDLFGCIRKHIDVIVRRIHIPEENLVAHRFQERLDTIIGLTKRRAEVSGLDANHIHDRFFGRPDFINDLLVRQAHQVRMRVGVGRNLVSGLVRTLHDLRILFDVCAHHAKGGLDPVLVQDVEQLARVVAWAVVKGKRPLVVVRAAVDVTRRGLVAAALKAPVVVAPVADRVLAHPRAYRSNRDLGDLTQVDLGKPFGVLWDLDIFRFALSVHSSSTP